MIGIFVDVSDIYRRLRRRHHAKLNYDAYLETVKKWGVIFRAIAYGMQQEREASGFITCLKSAGFDTRYKRPKIIRVNDREIKQCDWGIGITVDIIRLIDKLDVIVLGVSNPDYIPLVKWLRDQGKQVIIFASCVPSSLHDAANNVFEITEELLEDEN